MTFVSVLLAAATLNCGYSQKPPHIEASSFKGATQFAPGIRMQANYTSAELYFFFIADKAPGGTLQLQARPGTVNATEPICPIVCEIPLVSRPAVKSLLAPSVHTRTTPHIGPFVHTSDPRFAKDWRLSVAIPFYGRLNYWPFPMGRKRPSAWHFTMIYTAPDGKVTTLGTPEEPVRLVWGRPPAFGEARDGLFRTFNLVEAYRGMRAQSVDICNHAQEERWIGYENPGIETFAWRQADSEKLYRDHYALPIAQKYDDALKILEFQPADEKKRRDGCRIWADPKVLKMADPAKERLFGMIDDFNYASEEFSAARKAYLLARFFGRPMPVVKLKEKKKSAAAAAKGPSIDADEGMSLDDDQLDF